MVGGFQFFGAPIESPRIRETAHDPERAEHLVMIRWIKTLLLVHAIAKEQFLGTKNTRLRIFRW
jgi:hypothetical protein